MICHTLVDGDLRRIPGKSLLLFRKGQSPIPLDDARPRGRSSAERLDTRRREHTLHGVLSPLARYIRPTVVSQPLSPESRNLGTVLTL